MKRKGVEIIDLDVKELISDLNKALAAEAIAAYRYKILSKIVSGVNSLHIAEMFEEMSNEEWDHVGLFMERIVQLDGEPILSASDWEKHSYSTQTAWKPKGRQSNSITTCIIRRSTQTQLQHKWL
jgi:ferritin-like protein